MSPDETSQALAEEDALVKAETLPHFTERMPVPHGKGLPGLNSAPEGSGAGGDRQVHIDSCLASPLAVLRAETSRPCLGFVSVSPASNGTEGVLVNEPNTLPDL